MLCDSTIIFLKRQSHSDERAGGCQDRRTLQGVLWGEGVVLCPDCGGGYTNCVKIHKTIHEMGQFFVNNKNAR